MDFIIDQHGDKIEITDLEKALFQTENYKEFCQTGGEHDELIRRQTAYWADLYSKLMDHTYQQFLNELQNESLLQCSTSPLQCYGRYSRMMQLLREYHHTQANDALIKACELMARMSSPHLIDLSIKDQTRSYQFSPLISLTEIESLSADLNKCLTAAEADLLYSAFCNMHMAD